MPPRRRIVVEAGRAAVRGWRLQAGAVSSEQIAMAVRYSLEELAARHPGRSVEVRVPPHGAVQCVEGPVHRRGTPANTVETDAETWLALATGVLTWSEAIASGRVRRSGTRSDLASYLPVVAPPTSADHSPG